MVEINNQRKAFLWYAGVVGGTDNGRQKTSGDYDVIVGELFTDYSDHPRKLVTLNPKLKSTSARRYQLLSRWWDARQAAWPEETLRKVRTLWHCSRLRSSASMIDRGDIRQAIDRCSNIWASLPGAGYGQFEHKADSLITAFKEAGGTVREIDVWAGHRDYLRSRYLHHRLLSWALIWLPCWITPLLQSQRCKQNARELK